MKQFFKDLFDDSNTINEKSVVGYVAFFMMVMVLAVDVISSILGKEMDIHEFIFNSFVFIVLGAFGISSIDKFINKGKAEEKKDSAE